MRYPIRPMRRFVSGLLACLAWLQSISAYITTEDGFGYVSDTDVSQVLKLALDIRDMRATSDIDQKKNIYRNGANALPYTLAGLSFNSTAFHDFPMYNVYKYAFDELGTNVENDVDGFFDDQPIEYYANTLVEDLFNLNRARVEGDASLVLNVVMAYWGSLFLMLQACESRESKDVMVSFLDMAAALWIGEGQERSSNTAGYMLYNLAERTGTDFQQDQINGESAVNRNVLEILVTLKGDIQRDICLSETGYSGMRSDVLDLIRYTNLVLVQMFLHNVEEISDSDFIELYALSVIPQIAACNPIAYDTILQMTVTQDLTSETKPQVILALQESYNCLRLDCKDVGAYSGNRIPQCDGAAMSLAGYPVDSGAQYKAYIDRDVRFVRMFLRLQEDGAARDVYVHGWNTQFSLQQLATNKFPVPVTSTEFQRFQLYFDNETFADDLIMRALNHEAPFDLATGDDRLNLVVGLLQGTVLYFSMFSQLESSVTACQKPNATQESALLYWDGGAAFFIGSTEGQTESLADRGQSVFGLAKSFCSYFQTCQESDAAVNQVILNYLQFGRAAIQSGQCQQAQTIVEADIKPNVLIPLIQATLYYAATAETSSDGSFAALFALSRAVLPSLDASNKDDADVVKFNTDFPTSTRPDVEAIFTAFRSALVNMDTDCRRIGMLTSNNIQRGVCEDDVPIGGPAPQPPSTPSNANSPSLGPVYVPPTNPSGIAWGRYTFVDTQVADNDSKIALDVRDMAQTTSLQTATDVYGQNSKYAASGLSGNVGFNSLSDISTKAVTVMAEDPLYNFYRAAFYDDSDFEADTAQDKTYPYADTVVHLALDPAKGNSPQLAANAVVAMSTYMLIAHRLYEAVRRCQQQVDAVSMIDSAVSLWIGQEQGEGKYNSGWMFYAHAQRAMQLYGVDESEAPLNTAIMSYFNDAQTNAKLCTGNSTATFKELQKSSDVIIRSLSIVLLQRMLFHISEDNRNYVELYSLAFVPQIVSCDQGVYEKLRDILFLDFDRSSALDTDLVSYLAKSLNCLRISCSDLGDTSKARPELKSLVSSICIELDEIGNNVSLAGYLTDGNVYELSRIDLDILQIDVFMRTRAYDLAVDLYTNGKNSLDSAGDPISLKSLAVDDSRSNAGSIYTIYQNYFQSAQYADSIVSSAIPVGTDNGNAFESASRRQRSEVVTRTLQTMIPHMQIVSRLRSAVQQCNSTKSGQQLVDEAAALFVGSIEGKELGGSSDLSGKMLFALGKETCKGFGKCESHDDAAVNEFVLVSLQDVKRSIAASNCSAASLMVDDIVSMLPTSLVQGSLTYAVSNAALPPKSLDQRLGTGYILTSAVLPIVKEANQTSAGTILRNMDFNLDQQPVIDGAETVFKAYMGALPRMGINCYYVGTLLSNGMSACNESALGPEENTPTNLGDDLYVSTTNVQDRANIALDVKNIQEALLDGRYALARIIYREGENSPIYDVSGVKVDLRSLAKFSTNASANMKGNPLYQVSVFALRDSEGQYLGHEAWDFADTIVQEAFDKGAPEKSPIAAEAAVALNLWMQLTNELFETLSRCKDGTVNDSDGVRSIDEAAAYWIGDGQVTGDADKGHLLYALSERMGDLFKTTASGINQAQANVNILRLLHQAKIELSLPAACSADPATHRRLRHIVNQITSQMTLVNIQALIHNIRVGDRSRVRIYAHAVVPLVAACSSPTFDYLRGKLIDFTYNDIEVETIIASIYSTFPCFRLTCQDVGVHISETTSSCKDQSDKKSLAGYQPATSAGNFAVLDLDIVELDILMQMQAYGAAQDLYSFGKHTMSGLDGDSTELSLESLATDGSRGIVPQLGHIRDYYGGDDHYADTIIRYAFSPVNHLENEGRRLVVVGTVQFMIIYMAILQSMWTALGQCRNGDSRAAESWDKAAAWIIGSLEGPTESGSSEGRLFWALGKDNCEEFNTCSQAVPGSAAINDKIVLRLYTGLGAILANNCDEVATKVDELASLLTVPLIQGGLSVADRLRNSRAERKKQLLAEGYVYSQAIAPLVNSFDRDAAQTISDSFDVVTNIALPKGMSSLVAAYRNSLSGLGVNCLDVGITSTIDICKGTVSPPVGLIVGLVILFLVLAIAGFFLWKRYHRRSKNEQDDPVFVKAKGELNHTLDFAVQPSDSEDVQDTGREVTGHEDTDEDDERAGSGSGGSNGSSGSVPVEDELVEDEHAGLQVV